MMSVEVFELDGIFRYIISYENKELMEFYWLFYFYMLMKCVLD